MEYILYHASIESFKEFDVSKIRKDETDAPFNGFWFSSDPHTSCAWCNPKYLKTCRITLKNPCTWDIVYQLLKKERLYSCTELREKLIELGYDGIVVRDKPYIDKEVLNSTGKFKFKTLRGNEYELVIDKDYGGVDLYYDDECITGYCDVEDYLSQQETVVVTFNNSNIEILTEVENVYWK